MTWVQAGSEGRVLLKVWLQPRAAKVEVVGVYGDALKIKITAPPVEGKANKQLLKFLAERLQLLTSQINLRSGNTSRHKVVEIRGLSINEVKDRLNI